ncbi:hypothetical protein evm_003022 [Chilo suppressalis]|nr:hypothetical protein evm_003022 [Chilo suppressalis]
MNGIGRLGHDPPRGPSVDWLLLTIADAAGTNSLTCRLKHGGARDNKFLVTHPMTDHCESCLTATITSERTNHLRHRTPQLINVPTAGARAFPMNGIRRLGHAIVYRCRRSTPDTNAMEGKWEKSRSSWILQHSSKKTYTACKCYQRLPQLNKRQAWANASSPVNVSGDVSAESAGFVLLVGHDCETLFKCRIIRSQQKHNFSAAFHNGHQRLLYGCDKVDQINTSTTKYSK